MADYLLFYLNQTAQFDYVSYMKLDAPMDDARLMLAMTAVYQGMVKQARDMDTGEKNALRWGKIVTSQTDYYLTHLVQEATLSAIIREVPLPYFGCNAEAVQLRNSQQYVSFLCNLRRDFHHLQVR